LRLMIRFSLPFSLIAFFIFAIALSTTSFAARPPANPAGANTFAMMSSAAGNGPPSEGPSSKGAMVVRGVVADPSGAIVPNAEVDLVDDNGAVTATLHSDGEGNFQITAPAIGDYTLIVSEAGFDTVKTVVKLGAKGATPLAAPMLHIVLPISTMATTINVNAGNSVDLTGSENNGDTSVMSAEELKSLPIFDNDYSTAMSAFMDSGTMGTGGSGLLVDGVEANRATVSASAVQEIRINQDPYSAQYYWPGRGQMEIITKSAADRYHGQFNFLFRDSALNAENALAASKPFEQRRVYEGHVIGPIPHFKNSGFLVSFNRAEEDLDAVVLATTASPTAANPTGIFQANVPAPTRDTEFSTRASHQFGDKHSAYAQYAYQDSTAQNQGVGGQALAAAGYNDDYREDDVIFHVDSTLSPILLNQLSVVLEHAQTKTQNATEGPQVSVSGDFVGGSAQNDSLATEYNFRMSDMVSWTHGHHTVKAGIGIPHMSQRAFDDNTNALGTYTFAPTLAADGTVITSALDNYAANRPSAFTQNTGQVHFVYHQQEAGTFIQDQWKVTDRFSITPGIRYDWQNFLATDRLSFSPRVSFAWVLDPDSKMVVRGGGGLYYDRFGGGPLLDLARYQPRSDGQPLRRSVSLSLDPGTQPATGCYPITSLGCPSIGEQPANLAELQPSAKVPYQIQYGLSIERGVGKSGVASISAYSIRGIDRFRSVDINAPTPESDYTERPNAEYGRIREMQPEGIFWGNGVDISYHGELNKYFTGFGRYTWSRFESNQEGIGWFPQNQYDPNDEWANSSWDRRNRLGMYAIFNHQSVANLSVGIFANAGAPWTVLTGADPYGDDLFNARPDGVARNTENLPNYVDLDVRWGHDFHLTPSKEEESPKLGFSAGAFNVLNHENGTAVDQVESSTSFGDVTTAAPPRRIQLAMRFEF
jgi:hypothetical protein